MPWTFHPSIIFPSRLSFFSLCQTVFNEFHYAASYVYMQCTSNLALLILT
jgi:hypothetical protein